MTSPSFSMYRHYAEVQGANCHRGPTLAEHDFAIDVDAILAACDDSTRLIFVCSPNNPTGTTLPRAELERLLSNAATPRPSSSMKPTSNSATSHRSANCSAVRQPARPANAVQSAWLRGRALRRGSGPCDVIRMLSAVQAPYALATPVVECVEDALQANSLNLHARRSQRLSRTRAPR